jgi:uncharacterized protein YecE (DUF72 family)
VSVSQTTNNRLIRIGTAGYSYPGPPPKGWHGAFYPQARGRRIDELEYYSRIFNTVDINSSFYGPPSERMANAWVRKTPDDFLFTPKLWQKFTHPTKIGQGKSTGQWEPTTQADVDLFELASSLWPNLKSSVPLSCSIQPGSIAARKTWGNFLKPSTPSLITREP